MAFKAKSVQVSAIFLDFYIIKWPKRVISHFLYDKKCPTKVDRQEKRFISDPKKRKNLLRDKVEGGWKKEIYLLEKNGKHIWHC